MSDNFMRRHSGPFVFPLWLLFSKKIQNQKKDRYTGLLNASGAFPLNPDPDSKGVKGVKTVGETDKVVSKLFVR
jgi:hypothetical protein